MPIRRNPPAWLGRLFEGMRDRRSRWMWLLAYGLIVASLFYSSLSSVSLGPLSCARAPQLQTAIQVLDHGGPPLTSLDTTASPPAYEPAGLTDDEGGDFYLAELGHLGHTLDPNAPYRWAFLGLFTLTIAIYPLLFGAIFDSLIAGLLAPLLLWPLVIAPLNSVTDPYWVPAWVMATCLPVVLYAERKRGPVALGWLVAAVLVAGIGESIRTGAGYPIAFAALLVAWRAAARWTGATSPKAMLWQASRKGMLWRASYCVAVVLAYLATSMGVLSAVRDYRNSKIGNDPLSADVRAEVGGTKISSPLPNSHPLWHQIYIGLGFAPNRYHIAYSDTSAADYVHHVDPKAAFLGPRYSQILEKRVVHLAETDPGFVLGVTKAKAGLLLADAISQTPLVVLLLPLLMLGWFRRRAGPLLLVSIPALAVSFLPPLVVVPVANYERGWLTAVAVVTLVGALAVAAELTTRETRNRIRAVAQPISLRLVKSATPYLGDREGAALTPEFSLRQLGLAAVRRSVASARSARRRHPRLTFVLGALSLLLAGFALDAGQLTAGAAADRSYLPQFQGVQPDVVGSQIRTWEFSSGLPSDWLRLWGSARPTAQGTSFVTGGGRYYNELASPVVTLSPGKYQVVMHGSIRRGGMTLYAETADNLHQLGFVNLTENTLYDPGYRAGFGFELDRTQALRIFLENLSLPGAQSRWLLRSVSVASAYNLTNNCFAVNPIATPPPSSSSAQPTSVVRRWSLASGLPSDWVVEPHVRTTAAGPGGIGVTTNRERYGYQLATRALELAPGAYRVQLRAGVAKGGLTLAAVELGVGGAQWLLGQQRIGETLPGPKPTSELDFTLGQRATVELVLANAADAGIISQWQLDSLLLERAPPSTLVADRPHRQVRTASIERPRASPTAG